MYKKEFIDVLSDPYEMNDNIVRNQTIKTGLGILLASGISAFVIYNTISKRDNVEVPVPLHNREDVEDVYIDEQGNEVDPQHVHDNHYTVDIDKLIDNEIEVVKR